MTTVAIVALVLATLYYILVVRERDLPEPIPVSPVQHLEDRKRAIYDNLRDLQFEYRLGKLSDEDYQQNKQALQRELAGVLAEMEAVAIRFGLPRVAAPRKTVKKAGSVCPNCGAAFKDELKFCGECGKAMA